MGKGSNVRVVGENDINQNAGKSAGVPMVSVYGVVLPARVWQDTARALGALDRGEVDDVLLYTRGNKIKCAALAIKRLPRD